MCSSILAAVLLSNVSVLTPPDIAGAQPVGAAPSIAYPQTRRVDEVDDHFGVKVADPYRWLENDVRTDGDVKAWVDAENAVTGSFLQTLAGRKALEQRITELFDYERFPGRRRRAAATSIRTTGACRTRRCCLSRHSSTARDGWRSTRVPGRRTERPARRVRAERARDEAPLRDPGRRHRRRTLNVRDLKTGKDLPDKIKWVKFSRLTWAKDGSGFYHSRFRTQGRRDVPGAEREPGGLSSTRSDRAVGRLADVRDAQEAGAKRRRRSATTAGGW